MTVVSEHKFNEMKLLPIVVTRHVRAQLNLLHGITKSINQFSISTIRSIYIKVN